jgi:hypothetical protein
VYFDRVIVLVLSKVFVFPAAWHTTTSARSYRITIAGVVNALAPSVVCEVGCGLGSILSRIVAPVRVGYDIDAGVIRAATLVRSRKIVFRVGGLETVSEPHVDVLILVNWIHELSPRDLETRLGPLLPRCRYLLLDAIDADNEYGYRYKHDFSFLADKAKKISITRHPGEGRSFQLFRVQP